MTIGIFPALFYTFLLALCSARYAIEKRDVVGRLRIRRLRWRIEELAQLRFIINSYICPANQQPKWKYQDAAANLEHRFDGANNLNDTHRDQVIQTWSLKLKF